MLSPIAASAKISTGIITEEIVKLDMVSGTTTIAMNRISAMPMRSCSSGKTA